MTADENVFVQSKNQQQSNIECFFAKIAGIYPDGISIEINGVETEKHYKFNTDANFQTNDIAKILKIHGTYVIEYAVTEHPAVQYATEQYVKNYVDSQISNAIAGEY